MGTMSISKICKYPKSNRKRVSFSRVKEGSEETSKIFAKKAMGK
jgi:hypothetical protein